MSQQGTMQPGGSWWVVGGAATGEVEERGIWCAEDTSRLTSSFMPLPLPTPTSISQMPSSLPVGTGGRGRSVPSGPPPPLVPGRVHKTILPHPWGTSLKMRASETSSGRGHQGTRTSAPAVLGLCGGWFI